jgi:hypothetical protein
MRFVYRKWEFYEENTQNRNLYILKHYHQVVKEKRF